MSLSFFRKKKVTKEKLPAGKSSFVGQCFGRASGSRRFPMLVFQEGNEGFSAAEASPKSSPKERTSETF